MYLVSTFLCRSADVLIYPWSCPLCHLHASRFKDESKMPDMRCHFVVHVWMCIQTVNYESIMLIMECFVASNISAMSASSLSSSGHPQRFLPELPKHFPPRHSQFMDSSRASGSCTFHPFLQIFSRHGALPLNETMRGSLTASLGLGRGWHLSGETSEA